MIGKILEKNLLKDYSKKRNAYNRAKKSVTTAVMERSQREFEKYKLMAWRVHGYIQQTAHKFSSSDVV